MTESSDQELLRLMDVKKQMENQISEYHEILKANNNVGMKESLVDQEGYPRNDIDVQQVRETRVKLIRLQNDYKHVFKECENLLIKLHSSHKPGPEDKIGRPPTFSQSVTRKLAIVGNVAKGSPSDLSGLKEGDVIIEFGSVNSTNMLDLQTINAEVERSVDSYIKVIVQRDSHFKRLNLKPKKWSGKGYLGCMLLPVN